MEWRCSGEAPPRLTWLHGERAEDPKAFESEVTLVEQGDRTHITLRSVFPTLFKASDGRIRLQLLEARPMASGVVILRYGRA